MSTLPMWVIYDHPSDWPDWYVAREWIGEQPGSCVTLERDLERLRDRMRRMGLVCLARFEQDDPKILETWV